MTRSGCGPPHGHAVVVELAGLPGAGKTRRSAALAAWLTARGVTVRQPHAALGPAVPLVPRLTRKSVVTAAGTLHEPVLAGQMVRALLRSGQPRAADLAARFVQWQVTQRALAPVAAPGTVTLVDEGLLQCLWSIGLRGRVEPALEVLASARGWVAPDLLVVVRSPPEVAATRLAGRSSRHSRTQRLPDARRLAELERGALLLDRLVAWWDALPQGPRPRLELSGTSGVDPGQLEHVGRLALQLAQRPPVRPAGSRPDGGRRAGGS